MDSGNSGSFQSSSGEDEFDSQVINNNIPHVVSSNSNQPPLPLPQSVSSYMYHNPLSNYFDHISHPPPPPQLLQNHQNNTLLMNSDVDWLKTLRSETNSSEISTFQSLFDSQNQLSTDVTHVSQPQPTTATTTTAATGKNPRKRSRASRRAPTTVLTTDTSNFRAMVQEFTGIPAPPFASTPLFRSRGFDIFGAASNKRYTDTTTQPQPQPQPQPSYFHRPFPHKVQMGNSSIIDNSIDLSNTNNNITLGMNINATTSTPNALNSSLNYYQIVPQTSSHFNLSNPFVPSFQTTTKTLQESLDFTSNSNDSHIKMGQSLDDFCGQNGRPDFISSDQTASRNKNDHDLSWPNNGVGCSSQDDDQSNVIIRSDANGNYSFSS